MARHALARRLGLAACLSVLAHPAMTQPTITQPAPAQPSGAGDASPCLDAIRQAERSAGLPAGLLGAIGVVESGRANPRTRRTEPWPWTVDVEGRGATFDSREAAIAAVRIAWKAGARSIDVGCMQINLLHHPAAFPTLDDAFDPVLNATYAAGFLLRLHAQGGDWGTAAAAYHSQTPELGTAYRLRVAAWWPGAGPVPAATTARLTATQLAATQLAAPRLAAARAAVAAVDPRGLFTPEFQARLIQDAADRARRIDAAAGPSEPVRPASRRYASTLP